MDHNTSLVPSVGGTSLAELSGFLEIMQQQADRTEAKLERQRLNAEAKLEVQRKEAEAKLEIQRRDAEAKLEAQRKQTDEAREEAKPQPACEAIPEEELRGLGGRLTAMHAAKLLTDEQLWTMEDIVADCAVVLASATVTDSVVDKVLQMLRLSASIEADGSLARQLRRRFAA
jgi:adenine-specific DNA methylase